MGLGAVTENNSTYLSIAGGFIWNRKADKNDPNYKSQAWTNKEGETKYRTGAQYGSLTGRVSSVVMRTHTEFGESINVTVHSGGANYIISVSTNNRNSQDIMKALLVMDLEKDIYIRPYDFLGNDKKRAQGVTFKQDGAKLDLKLDLPSEFKKEKEFFAPTNRKAMKRFFEDLSDYFVSEVESKVVPALDRLSQVKSEQVEPTETKSSEQFDEQIGGEVTKAKVAPTKAATPIETQSEEPKRPTALRMKRTLTSYCKENYEGRALPELSREEIIVWYDLCIAEEELPFNEESNEVSKDSLRNEVNNLLRS